MSLFPATRGPTQCPSRRQLSVPSTVAPHQYSHTTLSRSPASPDVPSFLSHRCYLTWPHWAEFLPVLTPPGTDLPPSLLVSLTLSDLPCSVEISVSPGPFSPVPDWRLPPSSPHCTLTVVTGYLAMKLLSISLSPLSLKLCASNDCAYFICPCTPNAY